MKIKYTIEKFSVSVVNAYSWASLIRSMGLSVVGGNYRRMQQLVKRYGLDVSHFTGQAHNKGKKGRNSRAYTPEQILCENAPAGVKADRLRGLMIDHLEMSHECDVCGNPGEHQGYPLRLHIDHINGDSSNNKPDNLRFLCPNCHQQTPTWGRGTNIRIKSRPVLVTYTKLDFSSK